MSYAVSSSYIAALERATPTATRSVKRRKDGLNDGGGRKYVL